MTKYIYVISGGTMVHVRPHFALCAPAYGTVGKQLSEALELSFAGRDIRVVPIFTKMARHSTPMYWGANVIRSDLGERGVHPETNADLKALVDYLVERDDTRGIVLAAAVCDWEPVSMLDPTMPVASRSDHLLFGKDRERLSTSDGDFSLRLTPAEKIVGGIRKDRKDIFLVSFKTTAGKEKTETYAAGLSNLKKTSSNLVLANDVQNHHNVVVTPEEFPYYCDSREDAVSLLSKMIVARTDLEFVRTKVDPDDTLVSPLDLSGAIPANFVPVLQHLLQKNAFKPFLGKTSGHFGCKVRDRPFERISSERKVDHNEVLTRGMVKIYGYENGDILAGHSKPSVGEHTQQQIYDQLPRAASIVHFHSPLRAPVAEGFVPVREQIPYECGSIQCGLNTASGMEEIAPGIWAVHLKGHGPNIAFAETVDAMKVIELIDHYWDPEDKSGGLL